MDAPRRKLTFRRVLRALGISTAQSVALTVVFAGTLAGGVVLHANTPAFRRMAGFLGNRATASLFAGKLVIGEVTGLSLGKHAHVRVRAVEVFDPAGKRVIHATDIEGDLDLDRLLRALVTRGAPEIELAIANVGSVDVVLDRDETGSPTIARAFAPPKPKAEAAPQVPAAATAEPSVHIRAATIGHAYVRGNLVPPELDADGDALRARFDLDGAVAKITLDGGRVTMRSPRAPNQKAPIIGDARGQLVVVLADKTLHGVADVEGSCGAIPLVAHAKIDGEDVEAWVDVPHTDPSAFAAALTDVPITRPVEAHVRAWGRLTTIKLEARASVGTSEIKATGEIDLREGNAFKLDVDAARVDLRAYGVEADSDLGARGHAEGTLGGASRSGTFKLVTEGGRVAGQSIPAGAIEGRFEGEQITATFRAAEPGLETTGKATFDLATRVVGFDVQGRSSSLRAVARAPGLVDGAGSVRAQGTIDLERRTIQGTVNVSGDRIASGAFSAGHLAASALVSGPLEAPVANVGFSGSDVALRSPGKDPLVYPTAHGHAKVALFPTPRIVDAAVTLEAPNGGEGITASAASVDVSRAGVEARGVRVDGLGEPVELDANLREGQWHVRARGENVDLRRVALLGGVKQLELLPKGARAKLDVDVNQGEAGASGHIDVLVTAPPGALGPGAVTAEVHATVDRGKLTGTARLAADGLGQIEVRRASLVVPNRLDGASLRRTTGTMEIRGALDLSQGAALFAGEKVERLAGIAYLEARIDRGDPNALPALRATVRTDRLEVDYAAEPGGPPTEVRGVDLSTHVAWDGRTEDAELSLLAWDARGMLATASAKSRVPLAAWFSGAEKVDGDALGRLEVDAVAAVPERDVAELPSVLGNLGLRGRVDGEVHLSGTIARPNVTVTAHATNLRAERRSRAPGATTLAPIDGTLDGRWDGERVAFTFALDERVTQMRRAPARPGMAPPEERRRTAPKTPGHLRGLLLVTEVNVKDLLAGKKPDELPWRGSTEVEVENLPLGALALGGRDLAVGGLLTGRARVKDVNHQPSFEASGRIDGFTAGGATVATIQLNVGGRDASLFAHASITDDQTQATVQLASQSLRLKGVTVAWDRAAPTRVDYLVQNGRLALLAPALKSTVSEIDGRLDGAGSISIDGKSEVFEGGLALNGGHAYVNALGEEITGVVGTAKFERSGAWHVEKATGKIGGGEFEAVASGQMAGLSFQSATATIKAAKEGVPISAEGATFAEATGEVKLTVRHGDDGKKLLVDIELPRANVQLPDRGTQQLEPLDADKTISVGFRRKNGVLDESVVRRSRGGKRTTTTASGEPLAMRLDVTLGSAVRLEGKGLDVVLGGRTVVDVASELAVSGQIDLKSGTIVVHGRRFTVDRGTVTFPPGEDPGNPTVLAAAYWDAPDRTRVWVEFAGPLKSGRLTLRSEPAYSKNEILSVLLFGRPDPNMATSSTDKSGDASGATAVGTGFVASDLNRVLSEIDENLDVETDTLSGNRTRTKLGRSFFDRRLKVQLGYAPGHTYREPDTTYVFLNWQFIPKWSLLATRGDRGTSILDVLFQHRY